MAWKLVDRNGEKSPVLETRQTYTFGRGLDVDVRLPLSDDYPTDETLCISRHHGALHVGDNNCAVEDKKSRNGTFVNRKPITEKTPVKEGDEITFGPYQTELVKID